MMRPRIPFGFLTAVAALVAALSGLWNTYKFAQLEGSVTTLTTGHNTHINAAADLAPSPLRLGR